MQEYYGLTELADPSAVTVISSGHALTPLVLSTGDLGSTCTRSGEAYEGLLVRITNAQVMAAPNTYGELLVDDGTGLTQLEDDLFNTDDHVSTIVGAASVVGASLGSITGVVRFACAAASTLQFAVAALPSPGCCRLAAGGVLTPVGLRRPLPTAQVQLV